MDNLQHLKAELIKCLDQYKSKDFLVGRLNDDVLQLIVQTIYENPYNRFIQLVNTINFFYSTRIQVVKGKRDDNVMKIARILYENWNDGWNLSAIKEGNQIMVDHVQQLREKTKSAVGRDLFSLSTKIFHQLNSQHPIYDTRVANFLIKKCNSPRGEIWETYQLFTKHYFHALDRIGWSRKDVNGFDNAVWIFMGAK